MRVAAAVVSGLGAALGTLKGCGIAIGTLFLGLTGTGGFNPFLFLWMGTEGGIAIACVFGMVGAGFAIAGRAQAGAWLMLAAAVDVLASAYTYISLQPVAMGPALEPYLSPGLLPVRQ